MEKLTKQEQLDLAQKALQIDMKRAGKTDASLAENQELADAQASEFCQAGDEKTSAALRDIEAGLIEARGRNLLALAAMKRTYAAARLLEIPVEDGVIRPRTSS